MHYLLWTVGTDGDLNPYLGLGVSLRQRGYRVTVLTNPGYEKIVRNTGLDYIPVGDQQLFEAYFSSAAYFDPAKSWQLAVQTCFCGPMRQTYDIIATQAAVRPTTVISAAWGLGARIAQEKLGVRLITVHLEPHNIRSLYQTGIMPPPMMLGDWVPKLMKRLQFWIADRWFVDPRLAPEVNAFRLELGLPAVSRLTNRWWNSPESILGMYPEWFVPRQPDWPPQLQLVGFPLWDRGVQVSSFQDALEFAAEQRPIVFTAGSNNAHASRFFQTAIQCCDAMNCSGMLVGKQAVEIPRHLAHRVKQFSYVGFRSLLPLVAALVHHGGVGTTAQALAAGVPQLVLPTVHGTPDIAVRLRRLGVAESLKPGQFSLNNGCRSLGHLLKSSVVAERCASYREKMKSENAIQRACDLIERLSNNRGSEVERT